MIYRWIGLLFLALGSFSQAADVGPVPEALKKEWKLADYYQKAIVSQGLPILASKNVSDYALKEAEHVLDALLKGRDDVRAAIVKNKVRLAIMSPNEFTLDIPEHSDLTPGAYWNKRARGLGATRSRPAVSVGEENVLGYPGDPYKGESILVHEFSHVIHQMGLAYVDKEFEKKLKTCYDEAKRDGLWKDTYAMSNPAEYWAEAVQSWFHCNRTKDNQHNHVNSRAELKKYDPRIAKLVEDSFPKNEWIYKLPEQRPGAERAHLQGYDPKKAPRFAWPDKMTKEYDEYQKSKKKKD